MIGGEDVAGGGELFGRRGGGGKGKGNRKERRDWQRGELCHNN